MVSPNNRAAAIILSYASQVKRGALLKKLCCSESTLMYKLRKPGMFRLDELSVLQKELHISADDLMELVRSVR